MNRVPLALAALGTSVSLRTLRRWVADGRITAVPRGKTHLVDLEEIAELEERRVGGRLPVTRSGR